MKIVYTKHAEEKFLALKKAGWYITKIKVKEITKNPDWTGTTRYDQETALGLVDEKHILRIVLRRENVIIRVITFHIARKGKYESTL